MVIKSGFFQSIGGDRKYKADFFASYFSSFIGNGVFPNPSTNLQVMAATNLDVVVKPGKGWINGYYLLNDSDYTVTLNGPDGVLNRIDRIVFGLNFSTREISIYSKTGTAASTPVAPSLTRDATVYEMALADVMVGVGVTNITQSNITDQRFNTSLCGIVIGLIEQIDTTTVFSQYQQEFDDFMQTIEDILDEDTAGHLLNLIMQLQDKTNYANQAQAQAGTRNDLIMSPQRVVESISVNTKALNLVSPNTYNASTSPNDYPLGKTIMFSNSPPVGSRYNNIQYCWVETTMYHQGNASVRYGMQIITPHRTNEGNASFYRLSQLNGSGWGSWLPYTENLNALETTNKTSLVGAINEVKLLANDITNKWAGVIGAPLSPSDTPSQLQSKTQDIVSKLATNLTTQGVPTTNTEALDIMADKVLQIQTQPPKNSGTVVSGTSKVFNTVGGNSYTVNTVSVTGLSFTPKKIYAICNNGNTVYITQYDVDTPLFNGTFRCSTFNTNTVASNPSYLFNIGDNIKSNGFVLPVTAPTDYTFSWLAEG